MPTRRIRAISDFAAACTVMLRVPRPTVSELLRDIVEEFAASPKIENLSSKALREKFSGSVNRSWSFAMGEYPTLLFQCHRPQRRADGRLDSSAAPEAC
jgi:hypothetical protein